jgi:hypothetical protein
MRLLDPPYLARFGVVIAVGAALVTGCAMPAASSSMIPDTNTEGKTHPYSVSIEVTGGRATESTGTPQVSNEAFREALAATLSRSRLFAHVIEEKVADLEMNVIIFSIDQPATGMSVAVTMEAGWTLTKRSSGEIVWQKVVRSAYTASGGSAVTFTSRLRLATEGAARENISNAVSEISELEP